MGLMYAGNDKKIHAYLGNTAIYRMYKGAERIYPNSGTATYYVDTNTVYVEDINIDDSCLNPQTFTPTKSGYTFIGWREDTTASSSVLSSKIMDGNDVVLYAVFRQTITLSYNGNNATGGSTAAQTGYRYYNNGNTSNPSFILRSNGYSRTGYNFTNWRMGSTTGTAYNSGASVTLSSNTTFYAGWTAAISYKTIAKSNVVTAINNWARVRTLVEYGATFSSNPNVSIVGDGDYSSEYTVVLVEQTYCIVAPTHSTGGGSWTATVTISGNAYDYAPASGIGTASGEFEASINNWQGGSRTVSFGRTFASPPTVNWYSPNPSSTALASDWNISITNITTTGCIISWSAQTAGATHQLGWIAEGYV